jgi:hypothetical protein
MTTKTQSYRSPKEGEMTTDETVSLMRRSVNARRIWRRTSDTNWIGTLTELDPLDPVDSAWLNRIFHALMAAPDGETMDRLVRGYDVNTEDLDQEWLAKFGVEDEGPVHIPLQVEKQATKQWP